MLFYLHPYQLGLYDVNLDVCFSTCNLISEFYMTLTLLCAFLLASLSVRLYMALTLLCYFSTCSIISAVYHQAVYRGVWPDSREQIQIQYSSGRGTDGIWSPRYKICGKQHSCCILVYMRIKWWIPKDFIWVLFLFV